jgi:hypothetical protein
MDEYASSPTEQFVKLCCKQCCSLPNGLNLKEIGEETVKDKELSPLREALESDIWDQDTRMYAHLKDELMVYKNMLIRGHRIIIPQSLKLRCLQLAHEGHLGIVATKQRLRTN